GAAVAVEVGDGQGGRGGAPGVVDLDAAAEEGLEGAVAVADQGRDALGAGAASAAASAATAGAGVCEEHVHRAVEVDVGHHDVGGGAADADAGGGGEAEAAGGAGVEEDGELVVLRAADGDDVRLAVLVQVADGDADGVAGVAALGAAGG